MLFRLTFIIGIHQSLRCTLHAERDCRHVGERAAKASEGETGRVGDDWKACTSSVRFGIDALIGLQSLAKAKEIKAKRELDSKSLGA